MESFIPMLNSIDSIVWGPPLIALLVGTGIYLTVRLGLIQVFRLPLALSLILGAKNRGEGDVSSFKSLCVALSATVGTGNIVGVATAVKVGGPGALFWMWMAAFFGMATKYAEGLLAIKYRSKDENGEVAGGPMYYILNGMYLLCGRLYPRRVFRYRYVPAGQRDRRFRASDLRHIEVRDGRRADRIGRRRHSGRTQEHRERRR